MSADVSHFSMIGFPIQMSQPLAFQRAIDPLIQRCTLIDVGNQDRLCVVRDKSGAEIYIGFKSDPKAALSLSTANPAFEGEGRTAVEIVSVTPSTDAAYNSFEIRVSARFSGEQTPLIFDIADPRQAQAFVLGAKLSVDISAFSYQAEVYKNEKAYYRSQSKPSVKVVFASDSFVPTGMFLESVGGMANDNGPTAYADFVGTVLKSELRANQIGRGKFWWALVRTYGGSTINVVLDPSTVRQKLNAGSVLSGRFWLSARLAKSR